MLGHIAAETDLLLVLDWENACPFVEQAATYVLNVTECQKGLSVEAVSFFDARITLSTAAILQPHQLRS
jgi:hypothetical protein